MSDDLQRQALARDIARRLHDDRCSHDEMRLVDRFFQMLELGREQYGALNLSRPHDGWQSNPTVFEWAADLAAEDRDRAALHEAARVEMFGPPPTAPVELKRRTPADRRDYIIRAAQTGAISREAAEALLEQPAMPEPELGGESG